MYHETRVQPCFFWYFFQFLNNSKFSAPIISKRQRKNMFDGQINLLFSCSQIKGVFNLAKRRVLLRITPGCSPGVIWRRKTERFMGRIAIFLYLYIEEQAKPQGHAQK